MQVSAWIAPVEVMTEAAFLVACHPCKGRLPSCVLTNRIRDELSRISDDCCINCITKHIYSGWSVTITNNLVEYTISNYNVLTLMTECADYHPRRSFKHDLRADTAIWQFIQDALTLCL